MKMFRVISTIVLSMTLGTMILLNAGCSGTQQAATNPSAKPAAAPAATTAPTEKKILLTEKPGEWKADGVISDNEYGKMQVFGDMEVYSRTDGDTIRIAMRAKTDGYVALGFDPSERMKDADIVLGGVKEGKAFLYDMYSTGVTGPHPPDEQQGGKNDILVFGAGKTDGVTVVEFERKLVTGDAKDKAIKIGDNKIIWAIGDSPDIAARHVKRGVGVLKI
jgi:hypothetical protein